MKTLRSREHAILLAVLVAARRKKGLTQAQLANRIGWHQSKVAKIELGERRMDPVEFVVWAKGSGVTPRALFALFLSRLEETTGKSA